MLTKEKLEAKIAELEKALLQGQANLNATIGAIQFSKGLLVEWDQEEKLTIVKKK